MALQLGSFMDSAVKGFSAGLDLQDAVKQRKLQEAMAKRIGEAQAAIKAHENEFKIDATVPTEANANGMIKTRDLGNSILPGESGGMPDAPSKLTAKTIALPDQQVAQVNTVPATPIALDTTETNPNLLRDSNTPVALADGGLVDATSLGLDSASIMNAGQPQVPAAQPVQSPTTQPVAQTAPQPASQTQGLDSTQAQQPQAPAPTPQQRQAYYSRAAIDKELYDGLTDDAMKYGDSKAALQYFKASFDTSQNMIKDNLKYAQQDFQDTGDLTAYTDLYNHAYPDGRKILSVSRDDKDNYLIKSQGTNGKPLDATYSADQIKSMLLHFGDTEGLWKAQAATAAKRQEETNKTDDEIRKEKAKGITLAAGAKYINSDGTTYDNPKDDMSVSETELAQKAANGDQGAAKALKLLEDKNTREKIAGRNPVQPSEASFERQAYDDWAKEPANKGKGKNQYLKEKANWKQNEGGLDSVTTATEKTDPQTLEVTKESRTTHVPKEAPKSANYQAYLDRYEKYKGNPEALKSLNAQAKAKGIIK